MRVPICVLIRGHLHRRFRGSPAIEPVGLGQLLSSMQHLEGVWAAYLCISEAEVLTPRQSSRTIPTSAKHNKKRVLVRNTHIALVGGRFAFADFQVTPPFGKSMIADGSDIPVAGTTTAQEDRQVALVEAILRGRLDAKWQMDREPGIGCRRRVEVKFDARICGVLWFRAATGFFGRR